MKPAWTGFLLSLSLCLDLGLVNVMLVRTVLRRNATAGFLLGLGSSAGDMIYFALAVFGAAALLEWTLVRWILWVSGTSVLLFLAWRMAREVVSPRTLEFDSAGDVPSGQLFVTGMGLALASPTAILWFAAVGGSVIASFSGDRQALWQFAGGFFAAGILWSAFFAYGVESLRRILGAHLTRLLSLASGLLFLYFAFAVFRDGLRLLRPSAP